MSGIGQYVLSVVAVSILCGLVQLLIGKDGACAGVVKMITGIVLTVAVIGPILKTDFTELQDYMDSIKSIRDTAVWEGEIQAENEVRDIIIEKTRTYIMDRAAALGALVQAEVSLNMADPPVPDAVTISGKISPYVKQQLAEILQTELGIPKERQTWI